MRSAGLLIPKNNQLNYEFVFMKFRFKVMSQTFIFTIMVELYS